MNLWPDIPMNDTISILTAIPKKLDPDKLDFPMGMISTLTYHAENACVTPTDKFRLVDAAIELLKHVYRHGIDTERSI